MYTTMTVARMWGRIVAEKDIDRPVKLQRQPYVSKSKVIAEFVEAIPDSNVKDIQGFRTTWESQAGVREALSRAFANKGRAMLLVDYIEGAPSVRKKNAKLRVMSLIRQGYTEDAGWIVRAVDEKVYVLYQGAR